MATSKSSKGSGESVGMGMQLSSQSEIDQALAVLTAHKDAWATMDIPGRIGLLDQMKQDFSKVEKRWITAAMAAKDAHVETMAEGEEWWNLILVQSGLERFIE